MTTAEQKLKSFEEMKIRMNRNNNNTIPAMKRCLIIYDIFINKSVSEIIKSRHTSSQTVSSITRKLRMSGRFGEMRF